MSKRHKHDHEEHIDETWLIPYADLLTLLLALFIVLFASSQVDQKKLEKLEDSFNDAFNGGFFVFEQSAIVPIAENQAAQEKHDPSRTANEQGDTSANNKYKDPSEMTNEELEQLRKKEQEDLEKLKQQLDAYIKENKLTTELKTELNDKQLMIKISDNTLFDSGSATVKTESRKLAGSIGMMLKDYPEYEIIIAGHTDDQPIRTSAFRDNWDLSSMRALNFMKILLQNKDIVPERFSTVGYGEFRPIAENTTAAGRATNRRVEVSIIRQFSLPTAATAAETATTE